MPHTRGLMGSILNYGKLARTRLADAALAPN